MASLDLTSSQDGGVLKEVVTAGDGKEFPLEGDRVVVHYVGKLQDGSEFDSSRARDDPFQFEVGKGSVISGWDIGLRAMSVGEKCVLTISPSYGYGSTAQGKIPADSTLVFEIELLEVKGADVSADKDDSLRKRVLKKGEAGETPREGARVVLADIVSTNNGEVFDGGASADFILLEDEDESSVPIGVHEAIKSMHKGERAVIEFDAAKWPAYTDGFFSTGAAATKLFGLVRYELTLASFEQPKEMWDMDEQQKAEKARKMKERGNKLFRKGATRSAIKRYADIIEIGANEEFTDAGLKEEVKSLLVQAYLNTAACHLKLGAWQDAIGSCDSAIEKDPSNEKAFFRKAEAKLAAGDIEDAIRDFHKVISINADSVIARKRLSDAKKKMAELHAQQKSLFSKMSKGITGFHHSQAHSEPEEEEKEKEEEEEKAETV